MHTPLVVAHAACRGHAPENTLSGVRAALDLGADAIEIDVRCTSDGTPVLLHDATVDRTTDGSGDLDALTLRQARRLRIASDERIPTLRDVLREVDGRALVVLEVKPAGIERATLDVVRRVRALDWCTVHSFVPQVVQEVRALEPRMPCSLLVGAPVADWPDLFGFALSLDASGVSLHYSQVTPKIVRAAALRTLRVSTWTVNRRDDARRVAAAGVAAITSDYPDRVRRWLPRARA
jgi:glycerophosphoryl diester phosphodiesterase